MKTNLIVLSILLLCNCLSAEPSLRKSLAEKLREVDLIAIVTITDSTHSSRVNTDGEPIPAFLANATVERVLKGSARNHIWVLDDAQHSSLNFGRSRGTWHFLVLLKRSGNYYIGTPGLRGVSIISPAGDTGRVSLFGCLSLAETIAIIQKSLASDDVMIGD